MYLRTMTLEITGPDPLKLQDLAYKLLLLVDMDKTLRVDLSITPAKELREDAPAE
jgi:hypothetical protein